MMFERKRNLLFVLLVLSVQLFGQQIETYDWPTNAGEAFLSDKYKVSIEQNGNIIESQVIMSHSKDIEIPNFAQQFRGGRTFNWTMFSCDFNVPVTITVEKLFGEGSADVEIFPSPYNIKGTLSADNKKVSFTLESQKYVSVNFKSADNKHTSDGVVKHMLMIFAEPLQTAVPSKTGTGVHVYSENSTIPELNAATTIYFPQGYHDLRAQFGGNKVGNMGEVISSGKQLYFEGGAYVHGRIYNPSASNVKIFGRGVFTGRDFKWSKNLELNGGVLGLDSYPTEQAHIGISGNNNIIEGIIVCDGAGHGVNMGSGSSSYRYVKLWGWHPNNDGFRPWGGNNMVENCFIRACDDALYNKGLTVKNTIFWQGFNGAIVCLGWDGKYHTENSIFSDNYILYPEWRNIGNNNGIVMSQIDYDMKGTKVTIVNMHVDGNIPALVNLHTNSGKMNANDFDLPTDFTGVVGFVKGVVFDKVTVTGKQLRFQGTGFTQSQTPLKSLIRGAQLTNGDTYYIEDVYFSNVTIDGVCIDENNKDQYLTIDDNTSKNINFFGCSTPSSIDIDFDNALGEYLYPNPGHGLIFIKHVPEDSKIEVFNIQGLLVHKTKGVYFDAADLPVGLYIVRVNGKKTLRFSKCL
jgi:hypothetical protein